MVNNVKMSLSIQKTLADRANTLAQQFNIPTSRLFERALEDYINRVQSETISIGDINQDLFDSDTPSTSLDAEFSTQTKMKLDVDQGDIFWIRSKASNSSETGIAHPHVIIQDDILNHSRIKTVVACALTSNINKLNIPGNVLLEAGEANLPKQSVVEVSKVSTFTREQLGKQVGSLSEHRIQQILAGMRFLQVSYFDRS